MDSKIGIINTDYTRNSAWAAFLKGNRRTKVNALIKPLNNKTRVRLTISVQEKNLFSWSNASMSKSNAKEYYQKLFTEIGKRIGK